MRDTRKIIQSSRYIILLGCTCFFIYLGFLIISYYSAIDRLDRQFEESIFPKLTELIDHRIDLYFKPSVKGLSILSETLDWPVIMQEAVQNPRWLKTRMKAWAKELEINSIGISDRDRRIVWDYWSDKPIYLNPESARDEWFFDFWKSDKKPDWTYTLYSEDTSKGYQLYIDRLIYDKKGRPIGSIAAQISLEDLYRQLSNLISEGERVIILDDKANAVIDISRMEIGKGVRVFTFEDSVINEYGSNDDSQIIKKLSVHGNDYGRIHAENKNIYYKKTPLFGGAMSLLTLTDTGYQLQKERYRLVKDIIVLFSFFTMFIGGLLVFMMYYTQRMKFLAIKLEVDRSKFEDLLFIITHGFANEILLLKKHITGIPRKFSRGMDIRLSEIFLMIQNSVNAARFGGSKSLVISKLYDFSWQWEKLASSFRSLSDSKGQIFSATPAVSCMINYDEEMVYQILANLVSNAVKYAPVDGLVDLNAVVKGDTLFITISDNGPGFSEDDRKELFSKFRKLSARPSGGERSTGLGLYIVKQLAEACNIRLRLAEGTDIFCGAVWVLELQTVQSGR